MSGTAMQDENLRIRELLALDRSTLPPDGGPRFNRLIFSASPYLLQHAENPVDWYPWGEEAFRTAAAADKPVFLSIGYATCHWCHVMAHESFADPAVAAVLNRTCVAIKVDREERPDLDDQFMAVSQLMTGSGGWPLNLFLTPGRVPFFAATYIPKLPRGGMMGFIELLEQLGRLWRERRDAVERNCTAVLQELSRLATPSPGPLPETGTFVRAGRHLTKLYDPEWGGFGSAPKFPQPAYLTFLLRHGFRSRDPLPLRMVAETLHRMRAGGICDQLGFGFHRYSVDRQWLVPHFEKMLYDQAQIALAALETHQATGEEAYRRQAEEIFSYLQRDLRHPDGPFYAAEDADSEGEEGLFYLWTPGEVREVLGKEDGELFCRLFDVTPTGNFEGRSILHLPLPVAEFAAREGLDPAALASDLDRWREGLRIARERRIRPLRDEKLVTAWNGLAIAALARGLAVTGDERCRAAATAAAEGVLAHLRTPAGRLLRSRLGATTGVPAFLEDYACLIGGLIELHQATLAERWLATALELTAEARRLFDVGDGGGLTDAGSDGESLLTRQRTGHDGVVPSGNGLMAVNLVRLGRLTGDPELLRAGESLIAAFSGGIARQPAGYLNLLLAGDLLAHPEQTLTLVGEPDDREVGNLLRSALRPYLPGLAVRFVAAGQAPAGQPAKDGRATAYLCAEGACRPPVTETEELERLLEAVRG